MPDEPVTLPFTVPDLFAGLAEVKGLAKASPAEVVLEFLVADTVINLIKSDVKEVRVPRAEVALVRLKRGWFGAKVYIRLKSMKWLAELPGCEHGEITLRVARPDRDTAASFVQVLGGTG